MEELVCAVVILVVFGIMTGSLVAEDNRSHPPLRSPDRVDPTGGQEISDGKAQAEEKGS